MYRYSTPSSASGSHGLSRPLHELSAINCASVELLIDLLTVDSSLAFSTAQKWLVSETVCNFMVPYLDDALCQAPSGKGQRTDLY